MGGYRLRQENTPNQNHSLTSESSVGSGRAGCPNVAQADMIRRRPGVSIRSRGRPTFEIRFGGAGSRLRLTLCHGPAADIKAADIKGVTASCPSGQPAPEAPIGSSGCDTLPGRWSLTAPRPSFRWRLQVSVANVKFTGNPAAESFGALLGNQSRIRRRRRFKTGPVSWRSPNSFPIPAERKRPGGGLADVAERPLFRKTSIRLVRRLVADFPQKGSAPNGWWSTGRSASAAAV